MFSRFAPILARLPGQPFGEGPPIVPVVRLSGVIAAASTGPFRAGTLNLAGLALKLRRAFKFPGAKAVALAINSPGGSPAQSALIAARIRQHAEEEKLPVFAFVEDVAASGGYWLACAADEIFADETSILGSIGVISAGFGFPALLNRFGIERRLHAQGERKSLLDPFLPERPEDVTRLSHIQKQIHQSFIAHVKQRRGDKLQQPEINGLFTGDIFLGSDAVKFGLIDGIGDLRAVMRQRYGEKVQLPVIEPGRGLFKFRFGLQSNVDSGRWVNEAMTIIEHRALWARFGL